MGTYRGPPDSDFARYRGKLRDAIVLAGDAEPPGDRFTAPARSGATDNAAGCAMVMEAVRILQAVGAKPRRTIPWAWLEPFRYLGAATMTTANTGPTDHIAFTGVSLPGFEAIQGPLDYDARTQHTNLDMADYLIEDDLQRAALVMASLVYHTALRPDRMPRPPLPEAHR